MGLRLRSLVFLVLAALPAALPARAQTEPTGSSYLNPFPPGDVHKILAVGDDYADGLLYGLMEAFAGDTRVDVIKRHQAVSGLMRNDFDDRVDNLEEALARETPSLAVVMLGAWDRNPIRSDSGKRVAVGSEEWRKEYAARVDLLLKAFKRRNVAVYWVSLPNVRRPDADEDNKLMNEIVRERVYVNGMKFIDSYAGFIDENGAFSAYGPDQTGKMRLLREGDGVYFTAAGNRKLAHFVERDVKRDLTQAKAERNVPLAGGEDEQARIRPGSLAAAATESAVSASTAGARADGGDAPAAGMAGASTAGGSPQVSMSSVPAVRPRSSLAAPPPATDQSADNGKISLRVVNQSGREEVLTLDVVRPAIPASVVALVTRRESPDKPTQMGEQLVDRIGGGLTVMSSVTPSSTVSSGSGGRKLSPTQSPYYRVLMKGERLAPKRGRADDFSWPRPESAVQRVSAEPKPAARPAPAPPAPVSGQTASGGERPAAQPSAR